MCRIEIKILLALYLNLISTKQDFNWTKIKVLIFLLIYNQAKNKTNTFTKQAFISKASVTQKELLIWWDISFTLHLIFITLFLYSSVSMVLLILQTLKFFLNIFKHFFILYLCHLFVMFYMLLIQRILWPIKNI